MPELQLQAVWRVFEPACSPTCVPVPWLASLQAAGIDRREFDFMVCNRWGWGVWWCCGCVGLGVGGWGGGARHGSTLAGGLSKAVVGRLASSGVS